MNVLVDDIGKVVQSMQSEDCKPFYMYGHRLEISNRLLEMENDIVYKYKKYPLIALRMPFDEKRENGMITYSSINIAILDFTKENWNAEERYANTFKPILYPLYEAFKKALKNSGLFMWAGDQTEPPHTKRDMLFYGEFLREGNVKYIFNDPLDAVEITNLTLKQKIKNC